MFLSPKNPKYTKTFSRKTLQRTSPNPSNIYQGDFSLIAAESGRITNFQIEAIRRFMRRFLKKKAKILFNIFPNIPITKKPNEVRLGRGKGNVKYWSCLISKGNCIVEVKGCNQLLANRVLNGVKIKLPIKTFYHNKYKRWIL